MNQWKNSLEEIEKIKEYKLTKSDESALYFYKKFSKDIARILHSRIYSKFSSVPLEKNDFLFYVWKGIKATLNEYDLKRNENIFTQIVQKSYQKTLKEVVKFLSNGEILLNNAYSIDEMIERKQNIKIKNNILFSNLNYNLLRSNLIKEISSHLKEFNQRRLKSIIYLKSCGFSSREIGLKLKISHRSVKYLLEKVKEVGSLIYEELNISKRNN